jgi:protein CpxP
MKRNVFQLFAIGAAVAGMALAQAPATTAAPAAPVVRQHRTAVRKRMMQRLNLTDAQKQQAKAIFQQTRQSTVAVRQQLKSNREALAAAVKANNQQQIDQLSASQGQLRGQMLAARSEAMAKVYQILTPEQKAKAERMHQAIRMRMKDRARRG